MGQNMMSSVAERLYIESGIEMEIRFDGRSLLDFRAISIEDDIFPHVNGSSKISIGHGTDVICSVKVRAMFQ